jgi:cysteine synthase
MIAKHYTELIGHTPMLELTKLEPGLPARVLAKLEIFNPMSIKDRPALYMVRALEAAGRLTRETELIESSSGNTAIGVAALAATMGVRSRFFMPESVSQERVKILRAYGAQVVLTPRADHTRGAREQAMAYCAAHPHAIFLNQHDNEANPQSHYETTAPEIWNDLGGEVDAVVIGLGTAGSFAGIARYFKERSTRTRIIGFEPAGSPVYSGGKQGAHHVHGIGPGFITPNFQRARQWLDEIVLVADEDAYEWTRRIALAEGLLVGITSGAAAKVACDVARRAELKGGNVVCLFYDTGERYLSTPGLFPD